jgi:hypothetical protein
MVISAIVMKRNGIFTPQRIKILPLRYPQPKSSSIERIPECIFVEEINIQSRVVV